MKCLQVVCLVGLLTTVGAEARAATIGVYGTEDATVRQIQVPIGEPFSFWIVATEISGDIAGFECWPHQPDEIIVVSSAVTGWGNCDVCGFSPDLVVGFDSCRAASDLVLVEYSAFYLTLPNSPQLVCVGPAQRSSFEPPAAGYLDCSDQVYPFELLEGPGSPGETCTELDFGVVATPVSSIGALKSRF